MEDKLVSRNELVAWLSMWITEQWDTGREAEARELIFVRDTLLDDNWALLNREVN